MKNFGKVLPLVAAGLMVVQGLFGVAPASANYRNDAMVNTVVKTGAIGAGAGVLTSAITGKSLLKGAAVGAVVGAGSGAIYQTVRNNQRPYYGGNGYYNRNKWYANPGNRNYDPGYGRSYSNARYNGYHHGRGHHYGHRY